MAYGLTYPEMRALVYDKAGVSSSHALLTTAKAVAHLWRMQLRMVRACLAVGIIPVNLRKVSDINLAVTNPHYLPADLMQLVQLRAMNSAGDYTTLRMRTSERWDEDEESWENSSPFTTDGPMVYVMKGVNNTLGDASYGKMGVDILPAPSAAVTSGLRCRYVRHPMPFSDFTGTNSASVVVDIPGEFHEDLVHGAVWEFLTNNPSVPRQDYDKHWQIFEKACQAYVAMQGETNQVPYEGSFGSAIFGQLDSYWSSQ